jgi:hypothetical protein
MMTIGRCLSKVPIAQQAQRVVQKNSWQTRGRDTVRYLLLLLVFGKATTVTGSKALSPQCTSLPSSLFTLMLQNASLACAIFVPFIKEG